MSTYKVSNLDCPVCAAKVEEGLRKFPGVKSASIDFAKIGRASCRERVFSSV